MTTGFERAVDRHVRRMWLAFGEEVRRLREDAGLSRAELARAAGVDASYLGDIEEGRARPSVMICARLSIALGADLTLRAYPTTGPAVRDRHQAAIVESMLGLVHPRWRGYPEIAVRHPSRGWIDLGLHDPGAPQFVAIEVQSELRRLEQLLRWSEAKAAALPSWDGWGQLGDAPAVSRLLVVRSTRTNRAIASDHRRLLRTAFPADPVEALLSLQAVAPWPGPSLLWAARDRTGAGAYRLVARP